MYRTDIDGLRSFAIIPVVLFHLGFAGFSGGYVGVDVFFVISGYLITGIIASEIEKNKFSITSFYERRVRRIFPALFAMMFICIPLATKFMLPDEFKDFGQALFATTAFVSNILFWIESGYFDAEAITKPFLHTWSLSVEEQYYLFFPLLMIVINRYAKHSTTLLLTIIAILSLALSVWLSINSPTAGFYLVGGRLWELMIGSLLAINKTHSIQSPKLANLLGAGGLIALIYSVSSFDHTTAFPGYAALLPCLGTAAIIYSGTYHATFVQKLLSLNILVHIGKLSYSLYLWHWPLFVFAYLYFDRPPHLIEKVSLLTLSYVAAYLSWKMIEGPFREKILCKSRPALFKLASVAMLSTLSLGLTIHLLQGVPGRLPESALATLRAAEDDRGSRAPDCLKKGFQVSNSKSILCPLSDSDTSSTVMWGDSHAAALAAGITNTQGIALAAMQGCPPLPEVELAHSTSKYDDDCTAFNEAVFGAIIQNPKITKVILDAYWTLYVEGERLPSDPNHGNIFLATKSSENQFDTSANKYIVKQSLVSLVKKLIAHNKSVFIVGPVPELDHNGTTSIIRAELIGKSEDPRVSRTSFDQRTAVTIQLLKEVAEGQVLGIAFPHLQLCDTEYCNVEVDGIPVYMDRHHLSPPGARLVIQNMPPL